MLKHIRIVLVHTSHPGNIGATARAMHTMGLSNLYLVNPLHFPHAKATEMAAGADSVLEQATIVNSLETAIADCVFVAGTSTRQRSIPWPILLPRQLAAATMHYTDQTNIAMVFGPEQSGLSNHDLHLCHACVSIPTQPNYCSLNLAAAVQIIAYELWAAYHSLTTTMTAITERTTTTPSHQLANVADIEQFCIHFQQTAREIGFLKPHAPRQLIARMRRLLARAHPEKREISMLRGFFSAIQKTLHLLQARTK